MDPDETPVFDRDNISDLSPENWTKYVLREPLSALLHAQGFKVRLPLEHALRDSVGALTYPAGGYLAIDENGDPFGIATAQFEGIYRRTLGFERGNMISQAVEEKYGAWLNLNDINALRAFIAGDVNRGHLERLGTMQKLHVIAAKA